MNKSLFSTQFLLSTATIASVYLLFTTLLMNGNLVTNTFTGNYELGYKIQILISLVNGMWTSMSGTGLSFLLLTALLTGVNLSLLWLKIRNLKEKGNFRLIVGGSSLLGVVGSGCAACGLPVLAFLGLGGSAAYLPLRGMELSYLSVLFLLLSLYILAKTDARQSCSTTEHKQKYVTLKKR